MAKTCGCDAVKFQKRTVNQVFSEEYLNGSRESPWGNTQRALKEHLEFGRSQYDEIDEYCHQVKIEWFASPWDMQSLVFLSRYNLKYNKVASPKIGDVELLMAMAIQGRYTFISTGLCIKSQIDDAVAIFQKHGCGFMLMHCVNRYPCPDNLCDLQRIKKLKEAYKCSVGYSNHNPSILAPSLAIASGAEAVEVHITLDRAMFGSDQAASFEKAGLEYVVRDCRRVKEMIG